MTGLQSKIALAIRRPPWQPTGLDYTTYSNRSRCSSHSATRALRAAGGRGWGVRRTRGLGKRGMPVRRSGGCESVTSEDAVRCVGDGAAGTGAGFLLPVTMGWSAAGARPRGVAVVVHEAGVVDVGADVLAHLDGLLAAFAESGVSRDEHLGPEVVVVSGAEDWRRESTRSACARAKSISSASVLLGGQHFRVPFSTGASLSSSSKAPGPFRHRNRRHVAWRPRPGRGVASLPLACHARCVPTHAPSG